MGFMRMGQEQAQRRGANYRGDKGYVFVGSLWHAVAHISERLLLEGETIDPRAAFPDRAYFAMSYGESRGLSMKTREYVNPEGTKMGAVTEALSGRRTLGYYSVRYQQDMTL